MANTDRARKLLVRTALVTTTTIATLVGAQNLAMLDARRFQASETPPTETLNNVVIGTPELTDAPVTIERAAPNITVMHAAPSITVLRQSGQVAVQPTSQQIASAANIQPPSPSQIVAPNPVIQPPSPSQISAPSPVIVQQPVSQRSRSSR